MTSCRRHDPYNSVDQLLVAGERLRGIRQLRAELPGIVDRDTLATVEQDLAQRLRELTREAASFRPFRGYANLKPQ
jgi:hypothetical protein